MIINETPKSSMKPKMKNRKSDMYNFLSIFLLSDYLLRTILSIEGFHFDWTPSRIASRWNSRPFANPKQQYGTPLSLELSSASDSINENVFAIPVSRSKNMNEDESEEELISKRNLRFSGIGRCVC